MNEILTKSGNQISPKEFPDSLPGGIERALPGLNAQYLRLCMIFCKKTTAVHDFRCKTAKKPCTAVSFAQRTLWDSVQLHDILRYSAAEILPEPAKK